MNDQTSIPFSALSPTEQVVEIFYQRALEVTKVAYNAINSAYPLSVRRENPSAKGKYEEAIAIAKQHRNFHKNKVAKFVTALCQVKRHVGRYDYSEDRPTQEFRQYMEGQLTLLYQKLLDYADVLIPEDDIPAFNRSIEKVFETEKARLLNDLSPDGLASYEITPVLKEEDFQETYAPQYTVQKRTHRKFSDIVKGQE